jgi:hypothetical protein
MILIAKPKRCLLEFVLDLHETEPDREYIVV